jgi:hypothetical protein
MSRSRSGAVRKVASRKLAPEERLETKEAMRMRSCNAANDEFHLPIGRPNRAGRSLAGGRSTHKSKKKVVRVPATRKSWQGITKSELLRNLSSETYVRLAPSKIPNGGVGVIAIRDIPAHVNPFRMPRDHNPSDSTISVTKHEVERLPTPVRRMIKDFIAAEENQSYEIPRLGLNALNTTFYLNESKRPNLDIVEGTSDFLEYRTKRRIPAGQELLIDYRDFEKFDD